MTKNTVYLISGGANYYLSGQATASQIKYAGSGTPWTAESTTPYELSNNDVTGNIWVPQPAPRQVIYGGGPPFRNGRAPISASYDNMTEPVGIQMKATSKDNAIALLSQLRKILNTALFSVPCVLAVQGGTNTAYYEIYSADVPELPSYLNEPDGTFRATITWTRSHHGGLLSTAETVINGVTFGNTGTGSPDNVDAFTAGSGDLIYEGQPLNIKIVPANVANRTLARVYLASYLSRTYGSVAGAPFSTNSTTGSTLYTHSAWDVAALLTNRGVKPRVVFRCSSAPGANLELRLRIFFSTLAQPIFTGPWRSPLLPSWIPTTTSWYVDMGTFPTTVIRRSKGLTTQNVTVQLQGRSTDGASASISPTYIEQLLYYDWCRIEQSELGAGVLATNATNYLLLDAFAEQTDAVLLPHRTAVAFAVLTSSPADDIWIVRGTPPRYFSGAGLYAAWQDQDATTLTDYQHATTRTAVITVTHAPLYKTLRGAG